MVPNRTPDPGDERRRIAAIGIKPRGRIDDEIGDMVEVDDIGQAVVFGLPAIVAAELDMPGAEPPLEPAGQAQALGRAGASRVSDLGAEITFEQDRLAGADR